MCVKFCKIVELPVKATRKSNDDTEIGRAEWNDVPPAAFGKKTHTHICGDYGKPALGLRRGIEYHSYPPGAVSMGMLLL
jgi:hypothetical protein